MGRLGIPRQTLALIGANSLAAAVQGQFQFVLPWMLLARGHSPQTATLATAFVYGPLLLLAVPAGAMSDSTDPRRLMRLVTVATLVACALYPVAAFAGHDWFALVFAAAFVVGSLRNFSEGALFRAIGDTTRDDGLLRAHAVRTTVNQAAVFGSPFVGLLLFRFGGVIAVFLGICGLLAAAVLILSLVTELERQTESLAVMRENMADGLASLRGNSRLRTIGWTNVAWNISAGAAIGIMPAVLREYVRMDELRASMTLIAGAVAVVLLTIPLVRIGQRHVGATSTFIIAISVQGVAMFLFAGRPGVVVIAPLLYCLFVLSQSSAAASLNGARATEVTHSHQGLLNMALLTAGTVGFIAGVMLAAVLLGALGFRAVLLLIGAGIAATAIGFRQPLSAA